MAAAPLDSVTATPPFTEMALGAILGSTKSVRNMIPLLKLLNNTSSIPISKDDLNTNYHRLFDQIDKTDMTPEKLDSYDSTGENEKIRILYLLLLDEVNKEKIPYSGEKVISFFNSLKNIFPLEKTMQEFVEKPLAFAPIY